MALVHLSDHPNLINRAWWDYLVPKEFGPLYRRTDIAISRFVSSHPYGEFWLKATQRQDAILRLKPDDVIPILHYSYFGTRSKPALMPFKRCELEHRHVFKETTFESGNPLEKDELVTHPRIQIELVLDRGVLRTLKAGKNPIHRKIKTPSILFSVPAWYLLACDKPPSKQDYVVYQHIFGDQNSYPTDGYFYIGKSTRTWQKRWSEHERDIKRGSTQLFHRKFREEHANGRVSYVHHQVMGITENEDELTYSENFLTGGHWHDERCLNMTVSRNED